MTEVIAKPPSKVCALERALKLLPQIQVVTKHQFADGMYARTVARDKNVLIVGKVHKKEHFYMVTKGSIAVSNGDEAPKIYSAGDVIVSKPGTKRAVLALEDSICTTVHRTDKTDIAEIEAEVVEHDPFAMFDAWNQLKELK